MDMHNKKNSEQKSETQKLEYITPEIKTTVLYEQFALGCDWADEGCSWGTIGSA